MIDLRCVHLRLGHHIEEDLRALSDQVHIVPRDSVFEFVVVLDRIQQHLAQSLDFTLKILALTPQLLIFKDSIADYLVGPDVQLQFPELVSQLLVLLRVLIHDILNLHPFLLFLLHVMLFAIQAFLQVGHLLLQTQGDLVLSHLAFSTDLF